MFSDDALKSAVNKAQVVIEDAEFWRGRVDDGSTPGEVANARQSCLQALTDLNRQVDIWGASGDRGDGPTLGRRNVYWDRLLRRDPGLASCVAAFEAEVDRMVGVFFTREIERGEVQPDSKAADGLRVATTALGAALKPKGPAETTPDTRDLQSELDAMTAAMERDHLRSTKQIAFLRHFRDSRFKTAEYKDIANSVHENQYINYDSIKKNIDRVNEYIEGQGSRLRFEYSTPLQTVRAVLSG
jgi:hypothetical protein